MSTTMDMAKPRTLREEVREDRQIGKMKTGQIVGYLMFRHRVGLLMAGYPVIFITLLAILIHHYTVLGRL